MGRPPEHIEQALRDLALKISSDKGVQLIDQVLHEPKSVEKTDNLWIAFGDLDLEFDSARHFFNTIMSYMPSHVEIYEPENLKMDASEFNELSNFIMGKLHNYDSIAKQVIGERDILAKQLEFIKSKIKQTPQGDQSTFNYKVEKKEVEKKDKPKKSVKKSKKKSS